MSEFLTIEGLHRALYRKMKNEAAAEQKAFKPWDSVWKIVPETSASTDVILPAVDTVDLRSPSAPVDTDLPIFGVDEVIAKRLREEERELPETLIRYLAAKSPDAGSTLPVVVQNAVNSAHGSWTVELEEITRSPRQTNLMLAMYTQQMAILQQAALLHREADVQKFNRLEGQLVDQMNLTRKGQEENEALRLEKVALEAAKDKADQENANLKNKLRASTDVLGEMGQLKRDMVMLQVEMTKTQGIVSDLTKANDELRQKNVGLEMENANLVFELFRCCS